MILLIDNYDSFTYNLAHYLGTFTNVHILRNDVENLHEIAEEADGLVFSPGPGWPADAGQMEALIRDFAGKKPILGICLGHQAIAEVFGGKLGLAKTVMHGKQSTIALNGPSAIFEGIDSSLPIIRHGVTPHRVVLMNPSLPCVPPSDKQTASSFPPVRPKMLCRSLMLHGDTVVTVQRSRRPPLVKPLNSATQIGNLLLHL